MSGPGIDLDHGLAARPRRRAGLGRVAILLASLLALALAVFAGGFIIFAAEIARARPPASTHADAAVVLTGGPQRIDDAAALLDRGAVARLLISGVYERTSAEALAAQSPLLRRFMHCCVDIGRQARDTRGNAAETRDWVTEHGFRTLVVVTAAYHMPRSLAEIAAALPDVELVPYPVNPDARDYSRWSSDPKILRILLVEYMKYVVVRLG